MCQKQRINDLEKVKANIIPCPPLQCDSGLNLEGRQRLLFGSEMRITFKVDSTKFCNRKMFLNEWRES